AGISRARRARWPGRPADRARPGETARPAAHRCRDARRWRAGAREADARALSEHQSRVHERLYGRLRRSSRLAGCGRRIHSKAVHARVAGQQGAADLRCAAGESVMTEEVFSSMMLESMPGVVYFYDRNGRFLRWNRNFERVTGYSGEQIATMHPLDFFPP